MTFAPSAQALLGTDTPQNNANLQAGVNWSAARAYILGPNPTSGATWLATQNILNGSQVAAVDGSTILGGNIFHEYPVGLDGAGKIYVTEAVPGNAIAQVDQTTLVQIQQAASDELAQGALSAVNATDGTKWVLAIGRGGQVPFSYYTCYKATDLSAWVPGSVAWNNDAASCCPGLLGTGIGWVCVSPDTPGDVQQLDLHKVIVNTGSQAHSIVGSVVPTDIDAAWTQIYLVGICSDQDGNLLVQLQGQGGATNLSYIAKLSATDASVLWKTAVTSFNWGVSGNRMMQYSSINYHRFYYLWNQGGGAGMGVQILDTTTGAIVTAYTAGLSHLIGFSGWAMNDTLGGVLLNLSLDAGSGGPVLRGTTPAVYSGWTMLYVTDGPAFPPASAGRKFLGELGPVKL